MKRIKSNRIIKDGSFFSGYLYYENDKIYDVTDKDLPFDEEYDAKNLIVAPGFIDIHLHGGGGYEFIDATERAIINAANIHAIHGTTTLYPTISAYDINATEKALAAIEKYKESDKCLANIEGVHLEGPYFSKKQCGAQLPEFIREPSPDEYERLYNKFKSLIKRWTYAPELVGAKDFLKFLNEKNIVASAGHSDATEKDISVAYENGMRLITHLYSCTSTITRRDGFRILGINECAYLLDGMYVEAIADGAHLPPSLINLIYKIKGEDKICLVTDAIRHGGISSDNVDTDSLPYIIEDGVAKLRDRSGFAGSIATADTLIKTLVNKCDISCISAVKMMSETPARVMGIADRKGSLKIGLDADIVILDDDITVIDVFVMGKKVTNP